MQKKKNNVRLLPLTNLLPSLLLVGLLALTFGSKKGNSLLGSATLENLETESNNSSSQYSLTSLSIAGGYAQGSGHGLRGTGKNISVTGLKIGGP